MIKEIRCHTIDGVRRAGGGGEGGRLGGDDDNDDDNDDADVVGDEDGDSDGDDDDASDVGRTVGDGRRGRGGERFVGILYVYRLQKGVNCKFRAKRIARKHTCLDMIIFAIETGTSD
jgi:hypothetical protein